MTAYTNRDRKNGNQKDTWPQSKRRRSPDFEDYGFVRTDIGLTTYQFAYLGFGFDLTPSWKGNKAVCEELDEAEIFRFGTHPRDVAQRLKDIAWQLAEAEADAAEAEIHLDGLPETEAVPEQWQNAEQRYCILRG